ncbi:hypothetical protein L2E82_33510 [Cichorium intybus]|uniref:Uncharacterized protein n=1 Tax=Cichorium intybus TaxID=13427 RepID=A0ACB9BKD2_CICIN|nr:hypothetical protein L2E82_33510 [Cichorium intybus]
MDVSRMWSWICLRIALTLCLTLKVASEASPASLVGIVYCDICFNQDFLKSSRFISGASIVVECGGDGVDVKGMESRFRKEVKTNWKGEFRVNLPSAVTDKIRECSVKLIRSNQPDCPVVATATSSSIMLKTKTPGNRVFSAGVFTFRPRKQPKQCQTGTRNKNSNDGFRAPTPFPSPIGKQTNMEFDDLAEANSFGLPLPYQFQPPVPLFPFQFQPPPDSMFIPYSQPPPPPDSMFTLGFQPPPDSMFIPNFQPPPDSMFNPIPLQPPPESVFDQFEPSPSMLTPQLITPPPPEFFPSQPFPPIQPLPNLNQSPPPATPLPPSVPPPPFLPPFPPFPFQPSQGMPGTPPGRSFHLKKTSSP